MTPANKAEASAPTARPTSSRPAPGAGQAAGPHAPTVPAKSHNGLKPLQRGLPTSPLLAAEIGPTCRGQAGRPAPRPGKAGNHEWRLPTSRSAELPGMITKRDIIHAHPGPPQRCGAPDPSPPAWPAARNAISAAPPRPRRENVRTISAGWRMLERSPPPSPAGKSCAIQPAAACASWSSQV